MVIFLKDIIAILAISIGMVIVSIYISASRTVILSSMKSIYLDKWFYKLKTLQNLYKNEGKRYLTIAIGCTGGRHRSVMVAENLGAQLIQEQYEATVRHRDLALWA